jgi:uncharacterized protein YcsI (UPF0317 family)
VQPSKDKQTKMAEVSALDPSVDRSLAQQFRNRVRAGEFTGQTSGQCDGFVQANVTILPAEYATDFEAFCRANPRPCPLLEVVRGRMVQTLAPGCDLATDIPNYSIYRNGELVESKTDISDIW